MVEPIRELRAVADAASALRKAFHEQSAFYLEIFRQRREANQPGESLSEALAKVPEQEWHRATEHSIAELWSALDTLAAADRNRSTQS